VDNQSVTTQRFELVADVSSADPGAIEPVLRGLVGGEMSRTPDGFHVMATLSGESAHDLNRSLLSALRRVERRTRLRAEWTTGGVTVRFFDYVPKGSRPASSVSAPTSSSVWRNTRETDRRRTGIMPSFGSPFSGLANDRKLTDQELIRAIRFTVASEFEANQLYVQLAESTDDKLAIAVLTDIAGEELRHAGQFLRLLYELAPDEERLYASGAKEVERAIEKSK
jgi:hypothetical protein